MRWECTYVTMATTTYFKSVCTGTDHKWLWQTVSGRAVMASHTLLSGTTCVTSLPSSLVPRPHPAHARRRSGVTSLNLWARKPCNSWCRVTNWAVFDNEFHNITLSRTMEVFVLAFRSITINASLRFHWSFHASGASPKICDTRLLLLV